MSKATFPRHVAEETIKRVEDLFRQGFKPKSTWGPGKSALNEAGGIIPQTHQI